MTLMHNVTVRVTIEVLKKGDSWGSQDCIGKSSIEDTSSSSMDEIGDKVSATVNDCETRCMMQIGNTKRILKLEQQNKLIAETPA
jgi:hypothetical protein